ncbi:TonB-dependent receptor [Pontiellaceae bacterium B12227]|nr:TonB-dependent receptor [Pontiellaceae bacterium B12227]
MSRFSFFVVTLLVLAAPVFAQVGGIRGVVMDQDFEVPLSGVKVMISETGQETVTGDTGSYYLEQVQPGAYTVMFSKGGYTRYTQSQVVVTPGQLTEVEASLAGEYEEMDELVVKEINLGGASEIGLLNLRMESAAMMDSVGADLMSKAGASDAAQALALVPGTTVQDGKYAVVRGLPDRYVSSQMNGVRLPSADPDKRAVQLDQFPSAMIESLQVTKTFTPDQQGDASGGAVNVVLKGIPDEAFVQAKVGVELNSQVYAAGDDFLTYNGGGVGALGNRAKDIKPQEIGTSWDGAVGTARGDAPLSYKWELGAGGKYQFDSGLKVGALASAFYKRDAEYVEGAVDDKWWIPDTTTGVLEPLKVNEQDTPSLTSLNDVTYASEEVQWGGLAAVGAETENHALTLLYSMTRTATDTAILQEDTRGKHFFYPGHDPNDQSSPGHYEAGLEDSFPYKRYQTLEYEERTAQTLQLNGEHTISTPDFGWDNFLLFKQPELDWTIARSSSELESPDKRLFGSWWRPGYVVSGAPGGFGRPPRPAVTNAPGYFMAKPGANFSQGNLQRIWKTVEEDSTQYFVNGQLPFDQWTGDEGYIKVGLFNDEVSRSSDQDSYGNLGENGISFTPAEFSEYWTDAWPNEVHVINASELDVSYEGKQDISAWYYMAELPLWSQLSLIGGARFEQTDIQTIIYPEADVKWYPEDSSFSETDLNPGDGDVNYKQNDVLPSIGFELRPVNKIIIRGSYSETVARQTFKELTPVLQQEYLGDDVFIGNPNLGMSALKNYDIRFDYNPYPGGLLSFSWFYKDIEDPIEYRQQLFGTFVGTTAINYPEGKMDGFEVELRQALGEWWDPLDGLSVGGNVTIINSEVTLPESEQMNLAGINAARTTRNMLNAPEYLYNLNATYSLKRLGMELGLFYSVKGDTLVNGAGISNGNYVPDVYEKERGTLNFTLSQRLGDHLKISFKAKNLTDPKIEEVYRSDYQAGDVVRSSYTKGIDYSVDLTGTW